MSFNPTDYICKLILCECADDFQDTVYGIGKRVHSFGLKKYEGKPGFACTRCGKVKKAVYKGEWIEDSR